MSVILNIIMSVYWLNLNRCEILLFCIIVLCSEWIVCFGIIFVIWKFLKFCVSVLVFIWRMGGFIDMIMSCLVSIVGLLFFRDRICI